MQKTAEISTKIPKTQIFNKSQLCQFYSSFVPFHVLYEACLYPWSSQKHAVILGSKLPPPGQLGRLMEGKGTGWNNVFLPRAKSNQGNSPLSGQKKAAWTPHALKEA